MAERTLTAILEAKESITEALENVENALEETATAARNAAESMDGASDEAEELARTANESAVAIENEAESLQELSVDAEGAATAKDSVERANRQLEISAQTTSKALDSESRALVELAIASKDADQLMDQLARAQFINAQQAENLKDKFQDLSVSEMTASTTTAELTAMLMPLAKELDAVEDEAEEAATGLDRFGISALSTSLNLGPFNFALRNLLTQMPLLIMSAGTAATVLMALATAATAAAVGIGAIFGGGALVMAEQFAQSSEDIKGTMQGMKKVMEQVSGMFKKAMGPLMNPKSVKMFTNFMEALAVTVNFVAQSMASLQGELQKWGGTMGAIWFQHFDDFVREIEKTILAFMPHLADLFRWLGQKLPQAIAFFREKTLAFLPTLKQFAGQLMNFFRAFTDLGFTALEGILPIISGVLFALSSLADIINSLPDGVVEFIAAAAIGSMVLGKFTSLGWTTARMLGDLYKAIFKTSGALNTLKGVADAIGGPFNVWARGIQFVQDNLDGLNPRMSRLTTNTVEWKQTRIASFADNMAAAFGRAAERAALLSKQMKILALESAFDVTYDERLRGSQLRSNVTGRPTSIRKELSGRMSSIRSKIPTPDIPKGRSTNAVKVLNALLYPLADAAEAAARPIASGLNTALQNFGNLSGMAVARARGLKASFDAMLPTFGLANSRTATMSQLLNRMFTPAADAANRVAQGLAGVLDDGLRPAADLVGRKFRSAADALNTLRPSMTLAETRAWGLSGALGAVNSMLASISAKAGISSAIIANSGDSFDDLNMSAVLAEQGISSAYDAMDELDEELLYNAGVANLSQKEMMQLSRTNIIAAGSAEIMESRVEELDEELKETFASSILAASGVSVFGIASAIAAGEVSILTLAVGALSFALDAIGIGLILKGLAAITAIAGLAAGAFAVMGKESGQLAGVMSFLDGIMSGLLEMLVTVGVPAWNALLEVIELALTPFILLESILTGIGQMFGLIGSNGSFLVGFLQALGKVLGAIAWGLGGIADALAALLDWLVPFVEVTEDALGSLKASEGGVKKGAKQAGEKASGMFGGGTAQAAQAGKQDQKSAEKNVTKKQKTEVYKTEEHNYRFGDFNMTPESKADVKRLVQEALQEANRNRRIRNGSV